VKAVGKLASAAPATVLAFLAPLQTLGYAIGFFVLTDILTGMWASRKSGQPITSDRLARSVTKSVVYLIAIVVAHVAELYVIPDVPVLKVVSGIVASTELLSVYENLTRISGVDFKKRLTEWLKPTQSSKEDRGE
jgi:phage-related holin